MGHKFGDAFFNDMVDRGRRELGGLMFDGSSIAQPMYPLRGTYGPPKELNGPEPSEKQPSLEDKQPIEMSHDDHDKDVRDLGMERE